MNFDFTGQLSSLSVPTLVVCGADDPGTPASENRHLAGLVPGSRYQEIADARHFPNVEHPEIFNRIMMGWLETQRLAR
jgi:3-oxoadipate enol-lactonase